MQVSRLWGLSSQLAAMRQQLQLGLPFGPIDQALSQPNPQIESLLQLEEQVLQEAKYCNAQLLDLYDTSAHRGAQRSVQSKGAAHRRCAIVFRRLSCFLCCSVCPNGR